MYANTLARDFLHLYLLIQIVGRDHAFRMSSLVKMPRAESKVIYCRCRGILSRQYHTEYVSGKIRVAQFRLGRRDGTKRMEGGFRSPVQKNAQGGYLKGRFPPEKPGRLTLVASRQCVHPKILKNLKAAILAKTKPEPSHVEASDSHGSHTVISSS